MAFRFRAARALWASTLLAFLLVPEADALAFCGTYVASPGSDVSNHTSQVVLAREGDRTTLTLANDFEGDPDDFALILPVPEVLDASQVRVVDPARIERLDAYSTPRLVKYSCDDALHVEHWPRATPGCGFALGCSDDGGLDSDGLPPDVVEECSDPAVTVEAQFQTAEYDIVILSATGADGLYTWLDDHGYALPPGGERILDDYIASGSFFLAARVQLAQLPAGRTWLSPLQFSYQSPVFSLPIRIGTLSSRGEQEVVIYTLTDAYQGEVGISNYPALEVEDECMWPSGDHEDFGGFYRDAITRAAEDQEVATGWQREYSWTLVGSTPNGIKCDPCTVTRLYDETETQALGFQGFYAHLTRIRMIYRPEDAHQDLMLYGTGDPTPTRQIRFVDYDPELEFLFPICGQGYPDNPGECGDPRAERRSEAGGCVTPVPPAMGAILCALLLTVLRRRSS